MQLIISSFISLIYIHLVLTIEVFKAESNQKDMQLMKVIHDLKNPIMSIKQIVNNEEYELASLDLKFEHVANNDDNNDIDDFSRLGNSDHYEEFYRSDSNSNRKISRLASVCTIRRLSSVFYNYYNNDLSTIKKRSLSRSNRRIGELNINKEGLYVNPITIEHIQRVQEQVNIEIEDIEEMIDNLKTQFKSRNQMQFKEEKKEVNSVQFIESFKNTHMKLAESAKNLLLLTIKASFPKSLEIQKSLVKRILNNFISNSLKHTKNGIVEITFKIIQSEQMKEYKSYYQTGGEIKNSTNYLCFEVRDNGTGIPVDKIGLIFKETETDQSGQNWDGCGLGLPICQKLAEAINCRIYYNSIVDNYTKFLLIFNCDKIIQSSDSSPNVTYSYNVEVNDLILNNDIQIEMDYRTNEITNIQHTHHCNCILIAEDNKNILNRYVKYLECMNIPYMTFMNGSDCLSYIIDDFKFNCPKCSKMILVTDFQMPYMNGLELAQEIIKIDHENKIKIILLSADEPTEEIKSMKIFEDIIEKPIPMKNFLNFYSSIKKYNDFINDLDYKEQKKINIKKNNEINYNIEMNHNNENLLIKDNYKSNNHN